MNFSMKIEDYQIEKIHFMKMKKNIIMDNSLFIKIIYSDAFMVMNGIYIQCPFLVKQPSSSYFSSSSSTFHRVVPTRSFPDSLYDTTIKNRMMLFPLEDNARLIHMLMEIEHNILSYYRKDHGSPIIPMYTLKAQLEKGFLKLGISHGTTAIAANAPKKTICLKISGIWENESNIGINYKFFE